MGKSSDYIIRIQAQNHQLKQKLAETRGRLKGYNNSIARMGKEAAGSLGLFFGVGALAMGASSSIRKIANFEFQMDKVAAVSRASAKEVKQLEKNALDLGAATKFTATEIGKMQEEIARLGFSTSKILDTTDAIRKLATVADEDLGESAKVMVGTLNAFNFSAKESERVANVMAESFSMSALNLEKFQNSIANVGTASKAMGFSLENTTAMLGALVDANIDASKAGTDLRRIFINLTEKGLTYDEAMQQVRDSTNKVATAYKLFGARAFNAGIILAEQDQKVRSLTDAFSDSNRELDSMVDVLEDNLLTDWKLFTSAIDGVIQKGGAFNSFFREATQGMTRFVTLFNQFDTKKAIAAMLAFSVGGVKAANDVLKGFEKIDEKLDDIKDQRDFDFGTEALEIFNIAQKDGIDKVEDFMAVQGEFVNFSRLPEERLIILKKVMDLYAEKTKEAKDGNKKLEKSFKDLAEVGLLTIKDIKKEIAALKELQEVSSLSAVGAINDEIAALERLIKKYQEATESQQMTPGPKLKTKKILPEPQKFKLIGLTGKDNPILKSVEETNAGLDEGAQEMQRRMDALNAVLSRGVVEGIAAFAEGIGSGGMDKAFQGLFEVIGSGLQTLGKALIAFGVSMDAFRQAFKGNPLLAIAAGAAAIIAGTAVKNAASNLSAGATGGGGSSGGRGGFSSMNQQQSIKVQVQGELKANMREIVASIDNYRIKNSRIKNG